MVLELWWWLTIIASKLNASVTGIVVVVELWWWNVVVVELWW